MSSEFRLARAVWSCGSQLLNQSQAELIPLSWAFWLSEGVNQTKFTPASTAATTSGESPCTVLEMSGDSRRKPLWFGPRERSGMTFKDLRMAFPPSGIVGGGS